MSLAERYTSMRIAARASVCCLAAVAERSVAVVERSVVVAERSYSPTTLSSILTMEVAPGSRRRADEVVGAPAREKAMVGVVAGAVSLL